MIPLPGGSKKYGREDLLPGRVKVETTSETVELKAARKEIRELKDALADAHMDWCLESAFSGIACERLGMTPILQDPPCTAGSGGERGADGTVCSGRAGGSAPARGTEAALHIGRETCGERHKTWPEPLFCGAQATELLPAPLPTRALSVGGDETGCRKER